MPACALTVQHNRVIPLHTEGLSSDVHTLHLNDLNQAKGGGEEAKARRTAVGAQHWFRA